MTTAHRNRRVVRPACTRSRPAADRPAAAAGRLLLLAAGLAAGCGERMAERTGPASAAPGATALDAPAQPEEAARRTFVLPIAAGVELRGELARAASEGFGDLGVDLDVENPAEGLRALYEIDFVVALDARDAVELRAGDRLMYLLEPRAARAWRDVLRAGEPEAVLALHRVEGAAEEP